ncbi:hypothetical protein [Nocardia sp. NPDC058114]
MVFLDRLVFGVAEEALCDRRDEVILVSKFDNAVDNDPTHRGNSRR